MSAFEVGIDIDGSLDTVRLLSIHGWPFEIAGSKKMRLMAANITWVRVGRVDDLKLQNSMFLNGTGLSFRASASGIATGSISNTDFDGEHRAIEMSDGNISIVGGYFAGAGPEDQQVVITSGKLGIYGATIGCSLADTKTSLPTLDVDGPLAFLTVADSPSILCSSGDRPILSIKEGSAIFSNNLVAIDPDKRYVYPKISITGRNSRLTAIGNRIGDKGNFPGVFIDIDSDNFHRIIGNASPGWRSELERRQMPSISSPSLRGVYFGN